MADCEFDSSFDSSFAICVAAPTEEEKMRGVPVVGIRRRLRPVEAAGAGYISVLGIGTGSVERVLVATALVSVEAQGRAKLTQSFRAVASIELVPDGRLAGEAALIGTLPIPLTGYGDASIITVKYVPQVVEAEGVGYLAVLAFGDVQRGLGLMGVGSWTVEAVGMAFVERGLSGMAAPRVLALGEAEVDDEETALALLGLPSEVLV